MSADAGDPAEIWRTYGTSPTGRRAKHLQQLEGLAEALEEAAYGQATVDTPGQGPLRGQGARDRLTGVYQEMAAVRAAVDSETLERIATALETIADVLVQTNTPVTVKEVAMPDPGPIIVAGCCRVPLGEPHEKSCQYADGRHR
jgi:hypothetical protein